jgi:hypothetical protein
LIIAGAQYVSTALVAGFVPRLLGVSPTAVYIPWVVCVSAANFLILRHRIFHSHGNEQQGAFPLS